MNLAEYRSFDATGLAQLVRGRQVSAGELLDTAIASISETNPAINAVVRLMEDQAREAVARGLPDGPFQGVPFLIKDLGASVAGAPTVNGCRLFAGGDPADHDSEVVRRYRAAGLVIMGKTNTPEFGLTPTTEPVLFGPTRNPHDRNHTPGGSSGGAAAAVAAGMLPVAHASDGGGSIRIPASCCGLFGLKPTRGRVTYAPERGEGWGGMSTQHVVSVSVRDSAAILDATAGPAPGDPYWPAPPGVSFLESTTRPPRDLRVGLCVSAANEAAVDPRCRQAAEASAALLEHLGHRVETVGWPMEPELLGRAQGGLIGPNVAAAIDARLAELGRGLLDDDLEPVTAAIVGRGRQASAVDYVTAVNATHEIGRRMASLFESVDVLITPTLGCLPPPLGHVDGSSLDQFLERVAPMVAFTSLVNMSGQPAMSLPLGQSDGGLPIGTQVIGRYGDECTLFALASQIEQAQPWIGAIRQPET